MTMNSLNCWLGPEPMFVASCQPVLGRGDGQGNFLILYQHCRIRVASGFILPTLISPLPSAETPIKLDCREVIHVIKPNSGILPATVRFAERRYDRRRGN
jgi:hypothetical protein